MFHILLCFNDIDSWLKNIFYFPSVYLLSGALGFAVNENLDLIPKFLNSEFNYYTVIRCVMKILLPIHAVCAYLQAFNLSKVQCSAV